jgi:alpha-methylacyl-CoA racemase
MSPSVDPPLTGIRIVEFAGIGPGPFGTMLLGDLGADIVRIDRPGSSGVPSQVGVSRNRRSINLDLRHDVGKDLARQLVAGADVLVEGFRPGVMERLGFGPEPCLELNPGLIYARMTGWGQTGPLAQTGGHDLNYQALSGGLWAMGRADEPPAPPLNLVADFGGGGAFLALGVLAALFERTRSGLGQTIDVAMTDGSAALTAYVRGLMRAGEWVPERAANRLDGAAPYYDTYRTADHKFLAVGSSEAKFFAELLAGLELDPAEFDQADRSTWPTQKAAIAARIATRTRDEWVERFEDRDACVTPVLDWDEALVHPHNVERGTFVYDGTAVEPAPAPRFGRTPATRRLPPPEFGAHSDEILTELGYDAARVAELRDSGALGS